MILQFGNVAEEDRHRPFARFGDAARGQVLDDGFEPGVVVAFAQAIIKLHAQPRIDPLELRLRQRDHLAPETEVLSVAALQFDQFLAGALQNPRIGFALGVDPFVKPLHFRDGIGAQFLRVQTRLPADNQFAKLRAPIADVVIGDHPMAQQAQQPRQCVAQNRGADVADVHGLGDVGRTEVDHHGARVGALLKEQIPAAGRLA